MSETERIPIEVATDKSMEIALRDPGSLTQEATKDLIAPVINESETLGPIISAAAGAAVGAELAEADVITGSDVRLPRNIDRLVYNRNVEPSKYRLAFQFDDASVPGGFRPDGVLELEKAPVFPGSGFGAGARTASSRWEKTGMGDSLAEGYSNGAYWAPSESCIARAATADPRATYTNLGMSGATVDEVCIKVGALPLVAQAAVNVPASGSVAVTVQAGIGWRPDRTWEFHGTLGTVPGTLTRTTTATTSMTFVADSGKGGVTVPAGAAFVSDNVTSRESIPIIIMGRNDVSNNVRGTHATVVEHVLAGYARIIAWLDAQEKRYLVCGTLNATNEVIGTAAYNTVKAIQDGLALTYGPYFWDMRTYLVSQAIRDQGITPTSADNTAMTGDAPPPSVMDDPVHYSKASAVGIGANQARKIKRFDWRA